MLPAIILYMLYLVCINAARGTIEEGTAPVPGILWLVHLAFFTLGCVLLVEKRLIFKRQRRDLSKLVGPNS